jgi:hypothetical protein
MASRIGLQMFGAFRAAQRAPWAAQLPRAPAFRRFFSAQMEQPRLRLGSTGTVSTGFNLPYRMLTQYSAQLQGTDHQGRD